MLSTLYSCRCRLSLVWDSAKRISSQLKSVDYYIDVCLQPPAPSKSSWDYLTVFLNLFIYKDPDEFIWGKSFRYLL